MMDRKMLPQNGNQRRRSHNPHEVVDYAKKVKVRVPFHKSREQWQYSVPGGLIRVWVSDEPCSVVVSQDHLLDLRSGVVYKDRFF
jgi:hypothetical protein